MLKNRVAWITGAGSGLGRAIALRFANEGAHVIAADLNERGANETIAQTGNDVLHLAQQLDITDSAACRDAVAQIVTRFGKLDIFVNCAALCLVDPILEVTQE